jgi:hypothetical protein
MCKDVEGATADCVFKIHDLKCKKGHPLHLSKNKTFLCCRSGCLEIIFVCRDNVKSILRQVTPLTTESATPVPNKKPANGEIKSNDAL